MHLFCFDFGLDYPPAASVKLVAGRERAANENRVLVPAVDDDASDHVHDPECAFHPERHSALDFLLRRQRRGHDQHRRQHHPESLRSHA